MPISQTPSDPLFAVIGATGNLGGSVIQAIASSESVSFRVRAITRDATGAKAQQLVQLGVEVIEADLNSTESLTKAFEGASLVYGMTLSDYSEWPELQTVSSLHLHLATFVVSGTARLTYATVSHPVLRSSSKARIKLMLQSQLVFRPLSGWACLTTTSPTAESTPFLREYRRRFPHSQAVRTAHTSLYAIQIRDQAADCRVWARTEEPDLQIRRAGLLQLDLLDHVCTAQE